MKKLKLLQEWLVNIGFTSCQNEVNDVQEIIQMLQIQLLPTT
jgi:hypothetical protein